MIKLTQSKSSDWQSKWGWYGIVEFNVPLDTVQTGHFVDGVSGEAFCESVHF